MKNSELVLKYYPNYSAEEVNYTIHDFQNSDLTICSDCESPIKEEDLDLTGRSTGDGWNDPIEHEVCCPNCGVVSPEIVFPTLEQYLQNESN